MNARGLRTASGSVSLDGWMSSERMRGWEALADSHGRLPTQDLAWALAGAGAIDAEPAVVTIGDHASPAAIAPLARRRRHLEMLGDELFEPCDLLASSEAALEALCRRLVQERAPLLLRRIPEASPTIAALRRALGKRGLMMVRQVAGHPVIELNDSWCEPGGGMSRSRRSALRRARRRADRSGSVSVALLSPPPDEVDALLDEAFTVEARSWKGPAGTALAHTPSMAGFIRRYATEAAARGALRLQFLRIDDKAVAMQIAVERHRRMWVLKIGYDEHHAETSPGQLLLAESVADAARRGLERYQLLGEEAEWTKAWTRTIEPCAAVYLFPLSRSGALELSADAGQLLRRRTQAWTVTVRHAAERTAASRYVAGSALDSALRVQDRCAAAGYATTIGFWGTHETPVKEALRQCHEAAESLASGSQLSIKLGALGNDLAAADALMDNCRERDLGLHFDALGPTTADAALRAAVRQAERAPGAVGCTLTGRWRRSLQDARLAIDHGLRVRVVKSEWADPDDPERDPVAGFLEVIDSLAGSAQHVAVATHDAPLAADALARLRASGTPCELQVLHGMNGRKAVRHALGLDVPVRVYIPYGRGRVPYTTDGLARRPAVAARVAFDLLPLRSHVAPRWLP